MVNVMPLEEGCVWHEGSLISAVEGCKILEAAGADVVGLTFIEGLPPCFPFWKRSSKRLR